MEMKNFARIIGLLSWLGAASCVDVIEYSVQEEMPKGTFIGNVEEGSRMADKYDRDVLDLLRYTFVLTQGNSLETLFNLDEETGTLTTADIIDRDAICYQKEECKITLKIQVKPGQYFQILTVNIDIIDTNDHAPVFPEDQVVRSVAESARPGDSIAVPAADDPDSPRFGIQRYELLPEGDYEHFELQSSTALPGAENINLNLKQSLDREVQELYSVKIAAIDGGSPTPQTGTIGVNVRVLDINDNYPRFSNATYSVSVKENVPQYTKIVTVHATDPDEGNNGEVTYGFSSKSEAAYGNLFMIDGASGDVFVIGDLDFELASSYTLTITAQDRNPVSVPARVKLFIEVEDLNDNSPNIKLNTGSSPDGHLSIPEDSPNGTFIAHFTVTDPDSGQAGKFQCELDDNRFLLVKMYETEYKMVSNAVFDRERLSSVVVTMRCQDSGDPQQASVRRLTVDVADKNDHAPTFTKSQYSAMVTENVEVGTVILTVFAGDLDDGENSRITYSIYQNPVVAEYLDVNPDTGNISAKVELDREETPFFNFTVIARDNGSPQRQAITRVTVTVLDLNDEEPVFTKGAYEFKAPENVGVNHHVGRVLAFDNDTIMFNKFTYSLEGSPQDIQQFRIDDRTGDIVSKAAFDREHKSVYNLTVVATTFDGLRKTALLFIHIEDQNDNLPVFHFPSPLNDTVQINILDIEEFPHFVCNVVGGDLDHQAQVVYSMVEQYDSALFTIDSASGAIFLKKLGTKDKYRVRLGVHDKSDTSLKAQADLFIAFYKGASPLVGSRSNTNLGIIIGLIIASITVIIILIGLIIFTRRRAQREKRLKWMAKMLDPKVRPLQHPQSDEPAGVWSSGGYINPDISLEMQYRLYEAEKRRNSIGTNSDISSIRGSASNIVMQMREAKERSSLASIASSSHSGSGASVASTSQGSHLGKSRHPGSIPKGLDVLEGTPVLEAQGKRNKHKIIYQPKHTIQKPAVLHPHPHPGSDCTDSGRGSSVSELNSPLSPHWEQLAMQEEIARSSDMLLIPEEGALFETEDLPPGIHRSCLRGGSDLGAYAINTADPLPHHVRFRLPPEERGSLRSLDTSTLSNMSTITTLSSYGGALI